MTKRSQLFQQADAETEIARGDELLFIRWMQDSLRGDPSLIPAVARQIGWRLVHEDHVSANVRVWLALMLGRVIESPEAARLISGSKGRGAPRNGLKAAVVASHVMGAILENSPSVEDAIAVVAAERHISSETVKKYWEKNQEMLWDKYGEELRVAGFADLRDAVQAATTYNKAKVKK